MKDSLLYSDGWFVDERELTVLPRTLYPFKMSPVPDVISRIYERDYAINPLLFQPRIADRYAWTNVLSYSEDFTNTAWTKTNVSATGDQATAPDGEDTMDKLLETVTNGEHAVSRTASATAAAFEASVFAKGGLTRRFLRVSYVDAAATTFSGVFDIVSGVAMTVAGSATAKVVPMGNGTFRCVLKFTPASGSGTFKIALGSDASTFSYAGSTSAGCYLWGAQLSAGYEAPYVSTTSTARTMNAPLRDKTDPLAFLVAEQDPIPTSSEQGITRRTFSRVPRQQEVPSSLFVTKPSISGPFPAVLGESLVFQSDTNSLQFQFYSRKVIDNDSGPQTTFYPSGGTYTLTFAGQTTGALAYNASASTVQTALNALTSISARGGVTVTGSYNSANGFTVTFAQIPNSIFTLDAALLTASFGTVQKSLFKLDALGYKYQLQLSAYENAAPPTFASSVTPSGCLAQLINFSRGLPGYVFMVGNPNTSEAATGGTFTISVFGQTTSAITWDPTWGEYKSTEESSTTPAAVAIAAALNALSNVASRGAYTVYQYRSTGVGSAPTAIQTFRMHLTPAPALNGGTFTLTFDGQTTGTIAYNASASTIATALNALSKVSDRGGVSVTALTAAAGSLSMLITFPFNDVIAATSSLTPTNSLITTAGDGGANSTQTIKFSSATAERVLTFSEAHGLSGGETIYLQDATEYHTGITGFTVMSPLAISFPITPGTIFQTVAEFISAGKPTSTYTAGLTLTRVNRISEFFLPGVTPGIDTAADIPLPTYQGDDISLLNAIFDGVTEINYQVGELEQWRDTPILVRTVTTLNPQTL